LSKVIGAGTSMASKTIVLTTLMLFLWLCTGERAEARPPIPFNPSPDKLEGYCYENGGLYSPPNVNGVYYCLLPDGTLIGCGGSIPICTQSFIHEGDKGLGLPIFQVQTLQNLLREYEKSRILMEAHLQVAEVDVRSTLQAEKADMGAIEQALKKAEAARTAIRMERVKALRSASGILTPEQLDTWRSRRATSSKGGECDERERQEEKMRHGDNRLMRQ
jgi:Spy/CpxP family protein refolding chaperone